MKHSSFSESFSLPSSKSGCGVSECSGICFLKKKVVCSDHAKGTTDLLRLYLDYEEESFSQTNIREYAKEFRSHESSLSKQWSY